jgi:hypothetical protein
VGVRPPIEGLDHPGVYTLRTVPDIDALGERELAYSPPYSSAKDPVNMLGFVAQNVLDGSMPQWQPQDLDQAMATTLVLDVRSQSEYDAGESAPARSAGVVASPGRGRGQVRSRNLQHGRVEGHAAACGLEYLSPPGVPSARLGPERARVRRRDHHVAACVGEAVQSRVFVVDALRSAGRYARRASSAMARSCSCISP